MKETCWKLQGRPPQVQMVTQPCVNQRKMLGGQQGMLNYTSPSNGVHPSTCSSTQVTSHHPHDLKIISLQQQKLSLKQQIHGLQASCGASTSCGSVIGSTSLENSSKSPFYWPYLQYHHLAPLRAPGF